MKGTFLLCLLALASCAPQSFDKPALDADQARHLVSLYLGDHAWTLDRDSGQDAVREHHLYYAFAVSGTGGGDLHVFVNSLTGDLYKPDLKTVEQTARVLLEAEKAGGAASDSTLDALPEDLLGTFERVTGTGSADERSTMTLEAETVSLADGGQTLRGSIEQITVDGATYTLNVHGDYHSGQDASGAVNIPDANWLVALSPEKNGVRVVSVDPADGAVDVSSLAGTYRRSN